MCLSVSGTNSNAYLGVFEPTTRWICMRTTEYRLHLLHVREPANAHTRRACPTVEMQYLLLPQEELTTLAVAAFCSLRATIRVLQRAKSRVHGLENHPLRRLHAKTARQNGHRATPAVLQLAVPSAADCYRALRPLLQCACDMGQFAQERA